MAGLDTRRLAGLGWRIVAWAVCVAGGWVLLDLYLRVELPGAAWLAHQAFRCIVTPLEWLTEGEGTRLQVVLGAWVVAASLSPMAWVMRNMSNPVGVLIRWGAVWFWSVTALLVAGFLLLVVSLGLLMERALAGGLVVALGMAWIAGGLGGHRTGKFQLSRGRRWAALVAIALVGGGAAYYIYALFMTYGEGYPVLDFFGGMARAGVDFLWLYGVALVVVSVAAGAGVFWRRGDRVRRPGRLLPAVVAGVGVAVMLDHAFVLHGPRWTPLVVVPCATLLAALLWGAGGATKATGRPLGAWFHRLPGRLMVPFLLALLCIAHAYAARIFRCPTAAESPYLTRIANLPEVFRVTLFAQNRRLALSIRSDRRLGWIKVASGVDGDVSGVGEGVHTTAPGPANLDLQRGSPGRLAGVPEDFVHAPSLDRFLVSLTAHDRRRVQADLSIKYKGSLGRGHEINNMIATVSGDATEVLDVIGVPGLCWLNCMRWNDAERLLYLGCEDRPGLFRYDPAGRVFKDGTIHQSIGDVQDIAFDPLARRLYTVSLWKNARLTELDWQTLTIRRQLTIGGSHYDVVHDGRTNRIFASAWYASRVRVVDTRTFKRVGTIPTGLGTRALALAHRQKLLLVSSIYDGRLRMCNPSTGAIQASLHVGGHVKDIAVDTRRGVAYFWSQCGLYRLDLARVPALHQGGWPQATPAKTHSAYVPGGNKTSRIPERHRP